MRRRILTLAACVVSAMMLLAVGASAGNGSWTHNQSESTAPAMEYYMHSYTETQLWPSTIQASADCFGDVAVHAGFMENGVNVDTGVQKTRTDNDSFNLYWNRGSSATFTLTTYVACMKYPD